VTTGLLGGLGAAAGALLGGKLQVAGVGGFSS
jgi:hypothetical protein